MTSTRTRGPTENQRGEDRFPVFSVRSHLRGVSPHVAVRIADLSCGGARLEHWTGRAWRAPTGSTMVVELERDDAEPLRLFALPIWSTANAFGVRFLLLDPVDRLAIAEIIDEHRLAA